MTRARSASGSPRKSPLRVASFPGAAGVPPLPRDAPPAAGMTGEQLRAMQISEFCQWLRSRTNHEKRPFQEETITAYRVAARALDAWMTTAGMDGDFTACDAGVLNRFFRDYHAAKSWSVRPRDASTRWSSAGPGCRADTQSRSALVISSSTHANGRPAAHSTRVLVFQHNPNHRSSRSVAGGRRSARPDRGTAPWPVHRRVHVPALPQVRGRQSGAGSRLRLRHLRRGPHGELELPKSRWLRHLAPVPSGTSRGRSRS
jgi:hypothetical protein